MKRIAMFSLVATLAASGAVVAQSGDMKGMDMKNMDMMKGMDAGGKAQAPPNKPAIHKMTGVVKELDPAKGKVTLTHDPVKSLNWPAMTMAFAVKDKALFSKLAVGKKVNVEMTQQGADYIVTAVK